MWIRYVPGYQKDMSDQCWPCMALVVTLKKGEQGLRLLIFILPTILNNIYWSSSNLLLLGQHIMTQQNNSRKILQYTCNILQLQLNGKTWTAGRKKEMESRSRYVFGGGSGMNPSEASKANDWSRGRVACDCSWLLVANFAPGFIWIMLFLSSTPEACTGRRGRAATFGMYERYARRQSWIKSTPNRPVQT